MPTHLLSTNDHLATEAATHPNVGRMVIYRSHGSGMTSRPAVVLAQRATLCDLSVLVHDHGAVTQLGVRMIDEPPARYEDSKAVNVCWLKDPR